MHTKPVIFAKNNIYKRQKYFKMTNFVSPFAKKIFNCASAVDFSLLAIELFHYQYSHCNIYQAYTDGLMVDINSVDTIEKIPFLPIQFFKQHLILSSDKDPKICFESSATTGANVSKHYVCSPEIYTESFTRGFKAAFGDPSEIAMLALLPSYLERSGSSLVYMADHLIHLSKYKESGFFLSNFEELYQTLIRLSEQKTKTMLIGVTFGLLDFIEKYPLNFPELMVLETGGMKGRREEITRLQLHELLCNGFGVAKVYSEYGMTELLSQAYTQGGMRFSCPSWMKVLIRETNDPLEISLQGKNGGLNIIDLANIESCAFIATQDLGTVYADGSFEVLGRFDDSDIRGCNLMIVNS
jgi:phenylacetate-coenzyme A ligase PaaK-like adenylate-forming protein